MSMPVCVRCKKNMAVVFITKIENGTSVNEGLCLKCAKELGIKPVTDLLDKFGLKDGDLEGLTPEAAAALEGYAWSGNIRELQNCIEKAVIMSDGKLPVFNL